MSDAADLTGSREELEQQLAEGAYRSSVDRILDAVGRILQRLARRANPPAPWVSALAIALSISLIAFLASLLAGGASRYGYRTMATGGALLFFNLIIARSTLRRTFSTLQHKLLGALESNAGLSGLHGWLAAAGNVWIPALVALLIYAAFIAFVLPNPVEDPSPVETVIMGGFMLLWTGFMIYYMVLFVLLPLRLGRCRFRLHAEDPASSEVLSDWSGMMSYAAYMFAFMLATGTLFTVSTVTFTSTALVFIIVRWLPLIALFVAYQMAISRVISRSKRRTLNEVEAQMDALRPGSEPPDRETRETLLWLWDYHDRIKGTRGSALNLKGLLNLANTLLIPLLAFLFTNRQALFDLLGWSP